MVRVRVRVSLGLGFAYALGLPTSSFVSFCVLSCVSPFDLLCVCVFCVLWSCVIHLHSEQPFLFLTHTMYEGHQEAKRHPLQRR